MQARRANDRVSIVAEPCPSAAIGRPAHEPEIGKLRHHRLIACVARVVGGR